MATFRSYPAYPLNAPGSQESLASFSSGVMAASSDATSQTTAETDLPSPTSPYKPSHMLTHAVQPRPDSGHTGWRTRTPENQTNASHGQPALASPPAVTTPMNGHKRMASGQIKYSQLHSPLEASRQPAGPPMRACSVGSTGSRASEAATNLKERLTYAMAKVQHGWEYHNIDQVEQLAAAAISPRTVISPRSANNRLHRTSPRSAGFPSRSLVDQFPSYRAPYHDQQIKSAPLPTTRLDRSSSDDSMSPPPKRRPYHDSVASRHSLSTHPGLAPAATLASPTSPAHRRSGSQSVLSSPTRADPTTPKAPGPLRTQTQTAHAEQEAMDALLLMGSPSNNGVFPRVSSCSGSQHSSATQSPRRPQQVPPPRAALQYRSESAESFGSTHGGGAGGYGELLRRRAEVLDQIEAET